VHQGTWNKPEKKDNSDKMASLQHYAVFHGILKIPIYKYNCYTVTVHFQSPVLTLPIPVKIKGLTN